MDEKFIPRRVPLGLAPGTSPLDSLSHAETSVVGFIVKEGHLCVSAEADIARQHHARHTKSTIFPLFTSCLNASMDVNDGANDDCLLFSLASLVPGGLPGLPFLRFCFAGWRSVICSDLVFFLVSDFKMLFSEVSVMMDSATAGPVGAFDSAACSETLSRGTSSFSARRLGTL